MPAVTPTTVVATREDLVQIDNQAWALYGDLATLPDANPRERQQAFEAALASTTMLLNHDRLMRKTN
jgi:hypothetical protein